MTSSVEPDALSGPPTLHDLQSWLQGAISAPGGGVHRRPPDAAFQQACEERILSARGMDAVERVALYARGYVARLQECLRADFSAVRALLGDALFERFTTGYLQACPPRDYSLFKLGAGFADYLERTRPPDHVLPEHQHARMFLPIDLARVERAQLEALREPGFEHQEVLPDIPLHALLLGTDVQVTRPPCSRRVETRHDVRAFLEAVARGERPEPPPAVPLRLGLSRSEYRPTMAVLNDWQWEALECCETPRPLSEWVRRLAARRGESPGAVLAHLALWLPVARRQGLLGLTPPSR